MFPILLTFRASHLDDYDYDHDEDDDEDDDGDDEDDDHCFQRGRAEPRDPDQEITKSERLHW